MCTLCCLPTSHQFAQTPGGGELILISVRSRFKKNIANEELIWGRLYNLLSVTEANPQMTEKIKDM